MAQEEIRLSRDDARKIAEMWNWFISSARHIRKPVERRAIAPAAADDCRTYWYIWILTRDAVESGNFQIDVSTLDANAASTVTQITVAYNQTGSNLAASLRNIADIGDGSDPENDRFTVAGGPLPYNWIQVKNTNSTGARIVGITTDIDNSSLNAGVPQVVIWSED